MRRRWFIGKSQVWLEAELSKAQDDLSAGSTNVGGGEGDSNFSNAMSMTPEQRIDAILYELHCLDPIKYPASVGKGTRVTTVVFRD